MSAVNIQKGDYVYYVNYPERKMRAYSNPFPYGRWTVVECRYPVGKNAKYNDPGLYAIESLRKWEEAGEIHAEAVNQ